MDPALLGSIIEAIATIVGIIVAVLIAIRQISSSNQQLKEEITASNKRLEAELTAAKEELRLTSYENLISAERQLFSLVAQEPDRAKVFLEHFGAKLPLPDHIDPNMTLSVMMQIAIYESLYYRHQKGVFPPDLWEQWNRSMANSFNHDTLFQWVWKELDYKKYLWREFVDHVEEDFRYAQPKRSVG